MAEPAALSSSKASSMAARKFDAKVEELLDQMLACLALCEIPSLSFCSPSSSLSVSPPIPVMFAKSFDLTESMPRMILLFLMLRLKLKNLLKVCSDLWS
ncbi:hypothetical protein S83_019938 [Arachis hypogaea]|nr:uncharacterized protein LOC112696912 isoform X3 [Arachis hypogaea]